MQTRNVIRDGMTRRGRIDPVERLHDALEFEYRPMLAAEVEDVGNAIEKATAAESTNLTAAAIADHLVEWSEVDEKEKQIPPTFENVARLSFSLLNKLYMILAGASPSALIPNSTPDEQSEYILKLHQHVQGVSPAKAEEQAVGNSETGSPLG